MGNNLYDNWTVLGGTWHSNTNSYMHFVSSLDANSTLKSVAFIVVLKLEKHVLKFNYHTVQPVVMLLPLLLYEGGLLLFSVVGYSSFLMKPFHDCH
jgi:hypothetical protein